MRSEFCLELDHTLSAVQKELNELFALTSLGHIYSRNFALK